jgi:hypothetical protein
VSEPEPEPEPEPVNPWATVQDVWVRSWFAESRHLWSVRIQHADGHYSEHRAPEIGDAMVDADAEVRRCHAVWTAYLSSRAPAP